MLAITTFSNSGLELYGKRFISTFKRYWPGKLIVYTEKPSDLSGDKVLEQNFFDIEPVQTFYKYIQTIPKAHGITDDGYNYNYDLWKFSRKVFAQWDVLRSHKGKVYWLDADTIIKKEIPEQFLEDLFNKKGIVSFFRPGHHSETGIVGFDTENPKFGDFLNLYIGYLKSGQVFNLPQWHDCGILDESIRQSRIEAENLTQKWDKDKQRYSMNDLKVFQDSVLHEYIAHRKGKKKLKPFSRA